MKIVITGPGRSGTTFLVSLFTMLSFNTGYSEDEIIRFNNKMKPTDPSRAGLEINPGMELEVVKSPTFCFNIRILNQVIGPIDMIYVPIRELKHVTESRAECQRLANSTVPVNGGWWGASNILEQKHFLAEAVYELCHNVSLLDVPIEFINFPKLLYDPMYLYQKLHKVLEKKKIKFDIFKEVHQNLVRPELVRVK